MSAALPTSSSPHDAPSVSHPPEIPRDSGPDPAPTVIVPPDEVIAETRPDESTSSLPPAPRPQSPEQVPRLEDPPARVELHAHPAPAHLFVPARPLSAPTGSHIERDRPLPAIPANATLAPHREASLRPRVSSDPGYGHPHRRSHRLRHYEPPPVQPLHLPGSGVFRQRSATIPGEIEFEDVAPERVRSPFQSVYPLGSVGARLDPTLKEALKVRDGASRQAKLAAYSINIAIALQVVLGALTTALGASLRGNSIRISVAALGSLATLVASYLARTRGSGEPETSLLREQTLNNFLRRLRSFILDTGFQDGHDHVVENFRNELERLLNPSDPNAKRNRLIFDPKIDEEALDPNDPSAHDRRRHHAHTETFKACHCDDDAPNSRRPKGKSKGKDGSKKGEKKHDKDGDGDRNMDEDSDEN
ncbi:hypothetical protein V8E53_006966 [Lactarius tabidus]